MQSNLKGLVVALLLPVITLGQVFKAPEFSDQKDMLLMAKDIERHSPFLQKFMANAADVTTDITPEEARALVKAKLKEYNNAELNKLYDDVDNAGTTQIGVALHILMNGLSNADDYGGDTKSSLGGGIGVYVMWTLANFILMPELSYLIRPLKADYGGDTYKERYSLLTLAFTAMYVARLQAISLLFGLSPNLGFVLSGKYKDGDDDWEDIDLDEEGFNKTQIGLGITAGIMLRNMMIIRLMYNLGLSKLYDQADFKMYALALSVYVPLIKR